MAHDKPQPLSDFVRGCRVKVRDPAGAFDQTEFFEELKRDATQGMEALPWAVNVPKKGDQGNLLGVYTHPIRGEAGPRVALVALDNKGGIAAVWVEALRLLTYPGLEVKVAPLQDTPALLQWRLGAREAFRGREGFVPPDLIPGEFGTVVDFQLNLRFAGQFVTVVELAEQDLALFENCIHRIDEKGDLRAATPPPGTTLFTLTHGFETLHRREQDRVGPRRREAERRAKVAESRTLPNFVVGGSGGDDVVDAASASAAPQQQQPQQAPAAVYVAQGYAADEFNTRIAADPTYYEHVEATPQPAEHLWQSRLVRPDRDPIIRPSLVSTT
jgi:hypothetical protein